MRVKSDLIVTRFHIYPTHLFNISEYSMDLGIKNRVALVMSAGGGLGSAIALALAREGATVAVSDQNREALENTVSRIRAAGGEAYGVQADLSNLESITALVADVRSTLGNPQILINNSGGPPPSPATGVAPEQWRNQFDSMVLSLMHLTDLLLPAMKQKGWGRIVTSTSSGVVAPYPTSVCPMRCASPWWAGQRPWPMRSRPTASASMLFCQDELLRTVSVHWTRRVQAAKARPTRKS